MTVCDFGNLMVRIVVDELRRGGGMGMEGIGITSLDDDDDVV